MRKWFAKRPAVSFYVLTLTLSRGYWLTLLALGLRVGPGSVSHFPGLLGPTLAAIAVIAVIGGRKALLELFGRMFLLGRIGLPSWFWRCRLNKSMAALVGPVLIGWLFALVCGAFVLAQVYVATGHSILCVALWHVTFNMMVSSEAGTGLPAAILSTAVMVWGAIVAVLRWRRSVAPQSLDWRPEPATPRVGDGRHGP